MSSRTRTGRVAGRARGRPTPQSAARLERRLLEIALQEFLQHGYGGASMTGIVRRAGISKTTLYSRFPSKAALFRAIVHEQIDELAPAAPLAARDGVADLEKGLASYADHMLARNLEGDLAAVYRLIYSEYHRFPELGEAAAERTRLGVRRIAAFIRDRADADGIPCKDPAAIAEAFILMLRGWYVDVMLGNREVSPAARRRWVKRAVRTLVSAREDW